MAINFFKVLKPVIADTSKTDPSSLGIASSLKSIQGDCFLIIEYFGITEVAWEIPCYPESISESQQATWSDVAPLGRTSPLSAYTGTGYRGFSISLKLHREMVMGNEDYIESLLVAMRQCVYPQYTQSGLIPPTVTIMFGEFKAKGFVRSVNFNWQKPIIDGKYQVCDVSLDFIDVPDEVIDANRLTGIPTNPFDRKGVTYE